MQRRPREPKPADPSPPEPAAGPAPDLASFEAMMLEIERIAASLERGDLPLQDSLAAFERASLLTKQAQRLLEQAEDRLTRLVEGGPGEVLEVPFSLDQTGRKDEG
jgi:exodeoxyribonuclease VII small subunit